MQHDAEYGISCGRRFPLLSTNVDLGLLRSCEVQSGALLNAPLSLAVGTCCAHCALHLTLYCEHKSRTELVPTFSLKK